MTTQSCSTFPTLTFTGDNLFDVIGFINDKNVVALHTTKACRVFHAISFEQPISDLSLKEIRVIYIDCNSCAGLLVEGEWDYYIKAAFKDAKELSIRDELRQIIIDQRSVPNRQYISLGQ